MLKYFMPIATKTFKGFCIFSIFLFTISSQPLFPGQDKITSHTPLYNFKIVNTFPHSEQAFTQGLFFAKGLLYEGTGRYGKSELTKRKLESIETIRNYKLPDSLFGEGITLFNDKIIQLTWRAGVGLVYDPADFRLIKSFSYSKEGWGITSNGKQLIMSNGTDKLYFLNSENYKKVREITVTDKGTPVTRINELEYIKDRIYANIWRTDRIAIINPETGQVEAWINLKKLANQAGGDSRIKTLNGIAYDEENDRLFVTGKLWPNIYEIKLIPSN
jgi:glutamine cyclotransferase